MRWHRMWLSGLMLCCGNVGAQEVLATPGARVRFTTRGSTRWLTAVVREVGPDSLRLDVGPTQNRPFATADIAELQVSLGRNHLAGMGAGLLIGAGIGGVGGALVGLTEARDGDYYIGPVWAGVIFAVPGALAGSLIGALVGTERWYPGVVATARRVEVSPRGISLRFALPR
ncbi:MAG: hypothetical protein JNJ98_08170 [Gemmatimonadetes bacterium]|nr:hypothetical protein [Gemmatimonadota bacterium]